MATAMAMPNAPAMLRTVLKAALTSP